MTVDKETMELIERRLAEQVEARVRSKLFKYYGSVGAVALTILGFFSYSIVSGLEGLAKDYAREAARPAVEEAEAATEVAKAKTTELLARLDVFEELQSERVRRLNDGEREILAAHAELSSFSTEIEARIDKIKSGILETEAQLAAQGARFEGQEVAGLDYVTNVEKNLAALAMQVSILEDQLSEMREKTEAGLGVSYTAASADKGQITRLAAVEAQAAPTPASSVEGTRVYFQFAGVKREVAQQISTDLKGQKFDVPGEERHKSAVGAHEVRFFHDEDEERAEILVKRVNLVLKSLGYKDNVQVRDSRNYRGAKTRVGTIELWLEPVPAG